jgi:RecA/RadA recombinase
MKLRGSRLVIVPTKVPTGITGFDDITGGGLPRGRTTLLVGGSVVRTLGHINIRVTNERVSSGVDRLDTMLGGGYYRGACVLMCSGNRNARLRTTSS